MACNTLPATPHTILAPISIFDKADGSVSCRVILPNSVDSLVREFRRIGLWAAKRWAQMDAAFEAYVELYRVGLINNNLLPLLSYDEEAARAYAEVAKRPAVTWKWEVQPLASRGRCVAVNLHSVPVRHHDLIWRHRSYADEDDFAMPTAATLRFDVVFECQNFVACEN